MIAINKGLEPVAWTAKKATPGFEDYEPIPELREALLIAQGFICAYCMRRIPTKDANVDATSKIEHIKSQEDRGDLQLTYSNMAICCPGNLNEDAHCDKLKGGRSVSFNLHTAALQSSISYSTKAGDIQSTNGQWNTEMNELLNLNHPLLKQNRKNALLGIVDAIVAKGWNPIRVRDELRKWSSIDNKGRRKEFCGIVIWYLAKKDRQQQAN